MKNPPNPLLIILAAIGLDLLAGDPPNRWHPVVWMGNLISHLRKLIPAKGQLEPLLGGAVIAWGGAGLVWMIGELVDLGLGFFPRWVRFLVKTAVLKSTFSLRGLLSAASDVEDALLAHDLPEARKWVSWHLVSRDTSQLDPSQVTAATIESLAENLSDGVIAPLFYYQLGGLPAALAYRYLNTCDAMLGYRDEAREWLGKASARTDDLFNIIPARLTAVGILLTKSGQQVASGKWHTKPQPPVPSFQSPMSIYLRDASQTDSPNAGHPMSAMAGVLGVELEKVGQYQLGKGLPKPQPSDIGRAKRVLMLATGIFVGGMYVVGKVGRFKASS